jgi:uncharacterized membrane protein
MKLFDVYLLFGLLVHVGLLILVDWLGYHHLVTYGYDKTILALALLNVGIGFGLYYLVFLPVRRSLHLRRLAREMRQPRPRPQS